MFCPGIQLLPLGFYTWPAIDWKAESTFSDELVTWNRFVGAAYTIILEFIVTGEDCDLSFVLHSDLTRTKDMACLMEGEPDSIYYAILAIVHRLIGVLS